jgi:hypothetical protein
MFAKFQTYIYTNIEMLLLKICHFHLVCVIPGSALTLIAAYTEMADPHYKVEQIKIQSLLTHAR